MAFELDACEDISSELEKVAISELSSARDLLRDESGNLDTRVHETRKHVKKLRALLRLVEPGISRATFRTLNAALRDIGKRIASARDSAAQIETWEWLVADDDSLPQATRDKVRDKLEQLREHATSGAELESAVRASTADLEQILGVAAQFKPAENGWEALGPGFRRTYRRGRKALATVRKDFSDEGLHEFRRFVKRHQYQVQLLEPAWKDVLHARRSAVSDLGELLGHHHDLSVIEDTLQNESFELEDSELELVRAAISRRKRSSETQAFALAERIYAEAPRKLERRFSRYFQSWLSERAQSANA